MPRRRGPGADSLYTRAVPAAVELTGEHLAIDDVWDVAVGRRPVVLGARGRERAAAAREFLESEVGELTSTSDPAAEKLETVSIKPKKKDISIKLVGLVWAPYLQAAGKPLEPAW